MSIGATVIAIVLTVTLFFIHLGDFPLLVQRLAGENGENEICIRRPAARATVYLPKFTKAGRQPAFAAPAELNVVPAVVTGTKFRCPGGPPMLFKFFLLFV